MAIVSRHVVLSEVQYCCMYQTKWRIQQHLIFLCTRGNKLFLSGRTFLSLRVQCRTKTEMDISLVIWSWDDKHSWGQSPRSWQSLQSQSYGVLEFLRNLGKCQSHAPAPTYLWLQLHNNSNVKVRAGTQD